MGFLGFENDIRSIASDKIDAENLKLDCRKEINDKTGRKIMPFNQTKKGQKELQKKRSAAHLIDYENEEGPVLCSVSKQARGVLTAEEDNNLEVGLYDLFKGINKATSVEKCKDPVSDWLQSTPVSI